MKITRGNDAHWRNVLFHRNPNCHWCGTLTIDPPKCTRPGGRQPNMATLDHIKSRPECHTKQEYRAQSNMVLSCLKCNAKRNADFMRLAAVNKDERTGALRYYHTHY